MRWQWNRSTDYGTSRLYGLHNFLRRLVDQVVIVGLEFDSDFLSHLIQFVL